MCAPCKIILDRSSDCLAAGDPIQRGVRKAIELILLNPDKLDPQGRFDNAIQNRFSAVDAWYVSKGLGSGRRPSELEYWNRILPILEDMAGVAFDTTLAV